MNLKIGLMRERECVCVCVCIWADDGLRWICGSDGMILNHCHSYILTPFEFNCILV